jgi:hypothetical protein
MTSFGHYNTGQDHVVYRIVYIKRKVAFGAQLPAYLSKNTTSNNLSTQTHERMALTKAAFTETENEQS